MNALQHNMDADRPLPHSADAERSVLGGVLLDNEKLEPAREILSPGNFYSRRHQLIFAALLRLHEAGTALDLVTLKDELQRRNTLEACGGPAYLAGLIDGVPRSSNVQHYARIVQEKAHRRDVINKAQEITNAAMNGTTQGELKDKIERLARTEDVDELFKPNLLDLVELDEQAAPRVEWIIQPWLAAGDSVLIGGDSGTGKSLLALDLALALTTGGTFLGMPVGRRYPVLFLDEENAEPIARWRLKHLSQGRSTYLAPLPLIYSSRSGFNIDNPRTMPALGELLDKVRGGFVILDTLKRFHTADENAATGMSAVFARLLPFCRERDVRLIAVHHKSKPSANGPREAIHTHRGSTDIPAAFDTVWGYDRSGDQRTLGLDKSRYWSGRVELGVTLEQTDSETPAPVRLHGSEIRSSVRNLIRQRLAMACEDGLLRADLVELVAEEREIEPDSAKRLTSKALAELSGRDQIVKEKEGKAMRYWLADRAPEAAK